MKIDPRKEIYVYLCIGPNKLSYISRLNSWHIEHVVYLRRTHSAQTMRMHKHTILPNQFKAMQAK